jgi:hypothetical protein
MLLIMLAGWIRAVAHSRVVLGGFLKMHHGIFRQDSKYFELLLLPEVNQMVILAFRSDIIQNYDFNKSGGI